MKLTDIAVNLADRRFAGEEPEIVRRAVEAGVHRLVVISSSTAESARVAELCAAMPGHLIATAGCHPHHASEWQPGDEDRIRTLIEAGKALFVGETGLDFNRDFSPRPDQERVFAIQLELAGELGAPLLLHERDAHDRFAELYATHAATGQRAVLHCFTGNRRALERCLALGLYIGITGWICDERRGDELRSLVADIPSDRLLLETDAPWLLPRDLRPRPRGGRNEPAFLPHILQRVAELRGEDPAKLARQTERNFEALSGLGQR